MGDVNGSSSCDTITLTPEAYSLDITVAELEALVRDGEVRAFEDQEDAIIMKYWGRIPIKKLLEYLNRTYNKQHTMCQLKHHHTALLSR